MKKNASRWVLTTLLTCVVASSDPVSLPAQSPANRNDPNVALIPCLIGAAIAVCVGGVWVYIHVKKACQKIQKLQTNQWPDEPLFIPVQNKSRTVTATASLPVMLETGDCGAGLLCYTNGSYWLLRTRIQRSTNAVTWQDVGFLNMWNNEAPPWDTCVALYDSSGRLVNSYHTNCPAEGGEYPMNLGCLTNVAKADRAFFRLRQP